ncbi:globin domain-containing protein [Streptomyces sp. NPDC060198]|uniref:globin domain-containing protein n=1 Tax=Streptomyces sp. NPDC060198 TaxID=3347070 RepID=UPI0036533F55
MNNTPSESYHALLARHEAMRLRRNILAPARDGARPRRTDPPQMYGGHDAPADQSLIGASLGVVGPLEELITGLYQVLFDRHPYLRSFFPESMAFQQAHLAGAFRFLIGELHRPEAVTGYFTQLGRDHRKLGVRPAHFAAFESALVEALRARAGARWSAAAEDAWLRMLGLAVSSMVRGENEAVAELASWNATVTSHELRAPGLAVLRVRPQQPYVFRAGHYASLETPLLEQAWRPYYLARAPHPDGELEFHVRARDTGGVGDALVHGTRSGDTVRIGAPRGMLPLPEGAQPGELLLIASGTGWAPMKALLQQLAALPVAAPRVRLLLETGARSGDARAAEDFYDRAWLETFRRRCPWLTVMPADAAGWTAGAPLRALGGVLPARPGAAEHLRVLMALEAGRPGDEASGAEGVRTVVAALTAAGVPTERVHRDGPGIAETGKMSGSWSSPV